MINKTLFIFIFLIASSSLYSFSSASEIGYIDLKYILKNSLPSKNLQVEIDKGRNLFQKSINQEEMALRQAEKELNNKRNNIDNDEFQELVKDFESKVVSIQKLVQTSRQQLEINFQVSQKLIADKVNKLVTELAEKENLLIVFKTDNIIYANNKINFTDKILRDLNQKEGEFNFSNIYTDMIENFNK